MLSVGTISEAGKLAYYRAALRSVRFVEARRSTDRRFGAEADSLWRDFKGELLTADRIDLLIRDADTEWPGAFGARSVFGLRAVAEDEPFGSEWAPLPSVTAEDLWRAILAEETPQSVSQALGAVASAWEIELSELDAGSVSATDRLVAVGPSAIAALVRVFAEGQDLDWAEQVVCVASSAGHRHLAACAAALVNTTKATFLLSHDDAPVSDLPASLSKRVSGARLVSSADANSEDLSWAERAVGA